MIAASKVQIGMLTRKRPHHEALQRLAVQQLLNPGLPDVQLVLENSSVLRARNGLAGFFMASGADCLISVDDDIFIPGPPANILQLTQRFDEYDIVGAACPVFGLFTQGPILAAFEIPHAPSLVGCRPYADCWERRGVQEVDAVSLGCVAIHRRVFEAVGLPYFSETYGGKDQLVNDFIGFCLRAKEAGFRIACDFDYRAEHFHEVPLLRFMEETRKVFARAKGLPAASQIASFMDEKVLPEPVPPATPLERKAE